jgi:hypothetical protein
LRRIDFAGPSLSCAGKTILQSAFAEATQTDKRTASPFLDTLSSKRPKRTANSSFLGKVAAEEERAHGALILRRNRRSGFQSQDRRQISHRLQPLLSRGPRLTWLPANKVGKPVLHL